MIYLIILDTDSEDIVQTGTIENIFINVWSITKDCIKYNLLFINVFDKKEMKLIYLIFIDSKCPEQFPKSF